MTFRWRVRPSDVWPDGAEAYAQRVRTAVHQVLRRYEPEIEAWMKANAPWTDRTGNARQTLAADTERLGSQVVALILSHGMEYGIFLELAHGGNWAVIGPALDHFAPRIWSDIVNLLR